MENWRHVLAETTRLRHLLQKNDAVQEDEPARVAAVSDPLPMPDPVERRPASTTETARTQESETDCEAGELEDTPLVGAEAA